MGEFLSRGPVWAISSSMAPQVVQHDLVMTSVLILALAAVVMYRLVLRAENLESLGGYPMKKVAALVLALGMLAALSPAAGSRIRRPS